MLKEMFEKDFCIIRCESNRSCDKIKECYSEWSDCKIKDLIVIKDEYKKMIMDLIKDV
jgi:hypothetical protein